MIKSSFIRMFGVCLLGAALGTSVFAEPEPSATQEQNEAMMTPGNLKAAYMDELASRDRYMVYASKADEEGYGQVASMFRAVARGEEIHANNLAELLSAKGEPVDKMKHEIEPLSTEENLQTALADQRYERDVLYPKLLKEIRKNKNKDAERTLNRNMAAEPLHMAWYAQALSDLNGFKGDNIDFMVCPNCGNTVRAMHDAKCPVCGTPREKFERVR